VGAKFASTSLFEFLIVFGGLLTAPAVLFAVQVGPRLSVGPETRQLLAAALALLVAVAYLAGNAVFVVLFALLAAAVVMLYGTDDGDQRAPILLVLAACIALLACEVVYLKDPYGEKLYRMNTVFKLYLQSWTLLAIAAPWCVLQLLERKWSNAPARQASLALVGAALLASCAYPIGVTTTRVVHRMAPLSLDGNEYLEREHGDDFAAIQWLRERVADLPVILEATGNPYSYYARFASNTGLPTVLGWGNHEGLWRGHETAVGQRAQEVSRMYNAPTLDEIAPLLDRYHVQYVVVGDVERKDYQAAGLAKFAQLKTAFSHGGTTIYER